MAIRQFMVIIAVSCLSIFSQAQPAGDSFPVGESEKISKPYRIQTSGKQVTIKCTKELKSVIVWTSGGHRVVEHKDVKATSYSFRITVKEKIFFIRIQLTDGNTYSEKVGIQ
jgi:hypothetical protein